MYAQGTQYLSTVSRNHFTLYPYNHHYRFTAQFPFRTIQIVLRLYQSPAEVLAGFDIDAPCFAFDGSCVVTNPRALVALSRQANTIDMSRRSPSYETRLAKYAKRGFEIYFPQFERSEVSLSVSAFKTNTY